MNRKKEIIPDFTLRFPFQFGKGIDFPDLANDSKKLGNLSLSIFRQSNFYVIEIKGLESEQAAKEYFNRIWAGMAWVSLNTRIPFSAETIFGNVTYAPDLELAAKNLATSFGMPIDGGVDGLASGDQDPVVFSSNKTIRTISFTGSASSSSPLSFNDIWHYLIEVINAPNTSDIILDPKLKTAFELYSAHHYEITQSASFLTLIMSLEILFNEKSKTKIALDLLNNWQSELDKIQVDFEKNSDDYISLSELKRELFYRGSNSKRSQMRYLIRETFSEKDKITIQKLEKEAVYLYDKRSDLVHKGILASDVLDSALIDAKLLVEKVIIAKFIRAANIEISV
jgi:hypothetical protein